MRAQLALFAILGIVILILFAGVYAVVFTASKNKAEVHTNAQTSQQEGSQAVQAYAQHCFESGVNRALELFGKQGGVIYESQGGRTPDPTTNGVDYSLHLGYKVNYLLFPAEETSSSVFFAHPPEYPWETYPYSPSGQVLETGYFGKTALAPLYSEYGINSWQSELEHFVKSYLNTSCDFQQWKGLDVLSALPNVSVRIAENTTYVLDWQKESPESPLFIADWPVQVTDNVIRASTQLTRLAYTPKVRLAKLYFFVKSLLIQDSSNMSFSMNGFFPQSFGVTVYPESSDSVISVNDQGSIINNKKFEFWFARKNRPPAIWYLAQPIGTICAGSTISVEDHDETLPSANDAALYIPLNNITMRSGTCSCVTEFCLTNNSFNRLVTGTQVLNKYTSVVEALNRGAKQISVEESAGFSVGDEILLIGMTGASAGLYETHVVSSVRQSLLDLSESLRQDFSVSDTDNVQIVRMISARTLVISGTLTAEPWNGKTGGIVAINANKIEITEDGDIDVTGKGFRGGAGFIGGIAFQGESPVSAGTQSMSQNQGGGGGGGGHPNPCGISSAAGGGGGGHKSFGGNGIGSCGPLNPCGGTGGTAYATDDFSLFMGAGGGGGGGCGTGNGNNGATGGGIVFIIANSFLDEGLIGNTIIANGEAGANGDNSVYRVGGGGGAGGTILLATNSSVGLTATLNAYGGTGGNGWLSGGFGGEGQIYLENAEFRSCDTAVFTRNVVTRSAIRFNNGALVNAVQDKGLVLNNTIGKGLFLINRSAFTVSAWINLKEYPIGDPSISHSTILAQWGNINLGNAGYIIAIEPNGKMRFSVSNSGHDDYSTHSETSVPLNTWHHIAGRYNGTTLQTFVDGMSDGNPATFAGFIFNTSVQFSIGAHEAPERIGFFNGVLDELRIYNRALSDDDIAVLGNKSVSATISNTFYHLHIHNSGSCGSDIIFPLNASDPDEEDPTFQFIPELPRTISNEEAIANRNEGIGITVQVNDSGDLVDWQRVVVQVR